MEARFEFSVQGDKSGGVSGVPGSEGVHGRDGV